MSFCSKCGKELKQGQRFCSVCGTRVGETSAIPQMVPAICTQCGAQIEVNPAQEAGICNHCGTAFITSKVINSYNVNITNNNSFYGANINIVGANLDNMIKLAENAIESRNGKEALDYANKALEIAPESSKVNIIKMKAIWINSDKNKFKVREVIEYGEKAIKYASAEERDLIQHTVYQYYLNIASARMSLALKYTDITLDYITSNGTKKRDEADSYYERYRDSLTLKESIPIEYIISHSDIQDEIVALAKQYVRHFDGYSRCLKECHWTLYSDTIDNRQSNLNRFKNGLPPEKAAKITEENNFVAPKKSSGGCYIATCVYGSYDSPQVWTLRRYRDYHLAKTWYGRFFIYIYYGISPIIVKWFGTTNWFQKKWKKRLDKMVKKLQDKGYKSTPYEDYKW